jgi:hypothetical protein
MNPLVLRNLLRAKRRLTELNAFSLGKLTGTKLLDIDAANSVVTSGKVSSITNAGSIACAFTEAEANRPVVDSTTFPGFNAPAQAATTRLVANNAASNWAAFSNASALTVHERFKFLATAPSPAVILLATMTGFATDVGFHLKILPSGALRLESANGVDNLGADSAAGVLVAGNKYTVQVTKTAGGVYTAYVNGVSVVTLTRTAISAASPSVTLHFGYTNLFFNPQAVRPRVLAYAAVHTADELVKTRALLETLYP